jgi:phospholipid transport system transporter-binding protein
MILRDGNKLIVQGAVTIDNVVMVAAQGVALFDRDDLVIDLAQVTEVDSSAVSMLLEWQRKAHSHNRQLHFTNLPMTLKSLAQLYGVSELIPLAC